jgi:cation diffusion facilitator family transporter
MADTDLKAEILKSPSERAHAVQHVTVWGLVSNLGLSAMKFITGLLANSQALVADGVHSLSDSTTDIAILIGAPIWSAPADAEHPYGHGRIETLITAFIGLVLGAVGIILIYNAIVTFQAPHQKNPGWAAFVVACVSIALKESLYQWTVRVGKKYKSPALMANAWHHRSDGLSSLPVALVVLGTKIHPGWTFLDHLGAIVVSLLILQAAWKIIWPALKQLADSGASQAEQEELYALISRIKGVRDVHALRTRSIGPGFQIDLHLQVDPDLSVREGHNLAGLVKSTLLTQGRDVVDVLIHIEPYEGGSRGVSDKKDEKDGA